jgi:hypothetical protein
MAATQFNGRGHGPLLRAYPEDHDNNKSDDFADGRLPHTFHKLLWYPCLTSARLLYARCAPLAYSSNTGKKVRHSHLTSRFLNAF